MLTGFKDGRKVPYSLGHFFIAIDTNAFTDPSDFKTTTGNILRELRASRKCLIIPVFIQPEKRSMKHGWKEE
jgi:LDH2 family malate/lactate/ureidoglycolate dehydrogenase